MKDESIKKPDISVCICTYKYPEGLKATLDSLLSLESNNDFTYEIIVVDNDSAGSAEQIITGIKCESIYYYIESKQGIAQARNLAVEKANGKWIAFVDDDEIVEPGWLNYYWKISNEIKADGYFAPVITRSFEQPPKWLRLDEFFHRARFRTGTELVSSVHMRTGNVFIKKSLLAGNKFDLAYGLTGGEDTELFERLVRNGAKFYWCDEAVVYEYLKYGRLTFAWIIKRSFRVGITHTLVQKKYNTIFGNLLGITKAAGAFLVLTLILPLSLFGGVSAMAKRLRRIAIQIGHISAYCNYKFLEYRSS